MEGDTVRMVLTDDRWASTPLSHQLIDDRRQTTYDNAESRDKRQERREIWNLEFGIWNLEFGIWSLELGI